MRTIWKFPLKIIETQVIAMPGIFLKGDRNVITKGNVLKVGVMNNEAFIWAMVDNDAPQVIRMIHMIWTGGPCDCLYEDYVGTIVCDGLVYHVFAE